MIMDDVQERAKAQQWSNIGDVRDEIHIFMQDEKKDREEATLNNVDLSNPQSILCKNL